MTARRTAFAVLGAILLLIGIIAATAAGWIALAELRGPVVAWLVFAAGYIAVGLIFLLLSRRSYHARDLRVAAHAGSAAEKSGGKNHVAVAMAEAFVIGLAAGMRR